MRTKFLMSSTRMEMMPMAVQLICNNVWVVANVKSLILLIRRNAFAMRSIWMGKPVDGLWSIKSYLKIEEDLFFHVAIVVYQTVCILSLFQLFGIGMFSATVTRLKTFWKEAPFLRLQPFDEDDSVLNDVFGIEFNSKLNRAKFMFDSTVCQSFLLIFFLLFLSLSLSLYDCSNWNENSKRILKLKMEMADTYLHCTFRWTRYAFDWLILAKPSTMANSIYKNCHMI